MIADRLPEAAVGVVARGEAVRSATQAISESCRTVQSFEPPDGDVGALAAETADLDALLVEYGGPPDDCLPGLADRETPPVLAVASDPASLGAALAAGADVVISAENLDRIPDRLESLLVGIDGPRPADDCKSLGHLESLAFETLMSRAEDHVFVNDRHGRYARVNRAKAAFHGNEPAAFVGRTAFDCFRPQRAARFYERTLGVMEGWATIANEPKWLSHTDGEQIHVRTSKHPIEDDTGTVVGTIGLTREITQLTKQWMMVEKMKEVVEHLYGTYDHNFRNRSQMEVGVATQLRAARSELETVRALLDADDASADATQGDRDGVDAVAATNDSGDAAEATSDNRDAVGATSGGSDAVGGAQDAAAAMAALDRAVTAVETAQSDSHAMSAGLNELVETFSDVISAVNTTGTVRTVDLRSLLVDSFGNRVEGERVTVHADEVKVSIIFDQLAEEVDTPGPVVVADTADGFAITVPGTLTIPGLRPTFSDQDLGSTSKPLFKLRLVAETLGWSIDTRSVDGDRTELTVDVAAWKSATAPDEPLP